MSLWRAIQRDCPDLHTPFFSPEYVAAVAAHRDDIGVAVLRDGADDVGFLPFQRSAQGIGRGVGGRLCEFHGVVAPPSLGWDPAQLLDACDLRAWHFDHLLTRGAALRPYEWGDTGSPYMDLSSGFDAYHTALRARGSRQVSQALRKARKLEREVGPLRFELRSADRSILAQLMAWKAEQQRNTGRLVMFDYPWVVETLQRIQTTETADFAGWLSVLYLGDRPIASHLGMRSHGVLHWWFPSYDRDYERFSPGLILLVRIAEAANDAGVRQIDLGKGTERYKTSFRSDDRMIAEGMVHRHRSQAALRRSWYRAKRWIRASQKRRHLEAPMKFLRRLREHALLR
ncbi:MAG: GNAT family N-acetyltransferase [Planctomycetota bacterium]